jgi:hypothetical protein
MVNGCGTHVSDPGSSSAGPNNSGSGALPRPLGFRKFSNPHAVVEAAERAAEVALEELTERWGMTDAAITRLWASARTEFVPFLDRDVEIPKSCIGRVRGSR